MFVTIIILDLMNETAPFVKSNFVKYYIDKRCTFSEPYAKDKRVLARSYCAKCSIRDVAANFSLLGSSNKQVCSYMRATINRVL